MMCTSYLGQERVLTIEVDPATRIIVQARGKEELSAVASRSKNYGEMGCAGRIDGGGRSVEVGPSKHHAKPRTLSGRMVSSRFNRATRFVFYLTKGTLRSRSRFDQHRVGQVLYDRGQFHR